MNTEFFEALTLLEKEKGIPAEYLLEKIKAAIAIAVKRDYGGSENGLVEIDGKRKIPGSDPQNGGGRGGKPQHRDFAQRRIQI